MMNNRNDVQEKNFQQEYDKTLEIQNAIKYHRLKEDADDAQHSEDNTKTLNQRYSSVFNIFFGGKKRFAFWIFIYLILHILPSIIENFADKYEAFIPLLEQVVYMFNIIFLALLSFPTAKGIRRLFKSIIDILKHKAKNI